jgi:hypothetical protein
MSFIVESPTFERAPAGMHLARCYQIIDLGTQKSEYMGQPKILHKISISWELHCTTDSGEAVKMKDGRPFAIFKNYTLSWADKANLRLDLQSWRGKPFSQEEMRRFDLKNVLGAWCMLNVIDKPSHDGSKIYSNINGVTPVPAMIKSAGLPAAVNNNQIFNLAEPDMEMFNGFSDHLKAKIMSSPEWKKVGEFAPEPASSGSTQDDSEDIPFN